MLAHFYIAVYIHWYDTLWIHLLAKNGSLKLKQLALITFLLLEYLYIYIYYIYKSSIIIKVPTNPSKLKNKKHRNYFMDIIYRMIMKVRTIGNLRQLTNALLMLNLEKESFIGYIVFFPNGLNEREESCL